MYRTIIASLCVLSFAAPASAVSLQNKDSKSYDITVKGSSSTMRTTIQSGTTKGSICSSCKISVSGVGEVEASGSDRVVIKNGSISK